MSLGAGKSSKTTHPLDHPTFLRSPISTLLNTLNHDTFEQTSVHNLLDAYSTLSYRIKTVAGSLASECEGYSSLQILKNNAVPLGRCMQRDIRRAFADPLASNPHVASLGALATTPAQTTDMTQQLIKTARETSKICLFTLQVVSHIFSLPALHILFPQSVLQQLLNDVLVIGRSSELPIHDSDKIRSLAAWLFSALRLPAPIVAANAEPIQAWLNDLPSTLATQSCACDIIHNLLSKYPDTFLRQSAALLPEILHRVVSSDASSRMNATIALAGYALARLSIRSATSAPDMLAAVHDFMRSQLPRNRSGQTNQMLKLLPDYIASAVTADSRSSDGMGPRWAIAAICCLTVLSGQGIFTGTRPMKLVLDTVEGVARRGRANLVACAWRCIIWAWLQIPSDEPTAGRPSLKEGAFGIVKQEPRGSAGALLVAGLLYRDPGYGTPTPRTVSERNLRWALVALKDIVSHASQSVYHDGLSLLGRLTSGIGVSAEHSTVSTNEKSWHPDDIVSKAFFSRHVLKSDAKTFDAALEAANRFDASVVRSFTEAEIVEHWDPLIEIWTLAVERQLGVDGTTFSLSNVLAHVWQALLLAQTQLTQEHGHLTANPAFTAKAVSHLAHFLESKRSPATKPLSSASSDTQRRTLCLCTQLFTIMRHVFSETWLSTAAGSLLTVVLQHTFDLSDHGVKISWSELCFALVSVSAPVLMARLAVEDEEHRVMDIKRELWRLAAKQWTTMSHTTTWDNSLDFLAIPLKYWSMDEEEAFIWTHVADSAFAQTAPQGQETLFMDELMQRLPENGAIARMFQVPTIANHLISRLQFTHRLEHPSQFLRVIDVLLCNLYTDIPEHISTALQLLKRLRPVLSGSPPDALVDVLSALSQSLALWIADKRELLLVEEYNDAVIPIYCDALAALHDTTITAEILDALAHFLYSAFVRMPQPCLGPVAFYDFWTRIYPSLKYMRGAYPEEIKTALHACRYVFGAMSSQDRSFDTESQSGSQAEWVSPVKSESLTPKLVRTRIQDLQKTPTTGKPSPALSPEIPYEGPPSRRLRSSTKASQTPPSRRLDNDAASSDFMPSSPTDAVRARRMAARPTSRVAHEKPASLVDRPLKRQRVDTSPLPAQLTSPWSHGTASSPSRFSRASDSKGESVVPWRRGGHGTPSIASTSEMSKGKRVLSNRGSSPPARTAGSEEPSSDDYDAWEAPMCDVQELSDEIPDSQPSQAGEDDSLLPSYMKANARGTDDHEHVHNDTIILDDAIHEITDIPQPRMLGKRARPSSPVRMHTAPAGLQPEHSPTLPPTLRRARTASAHLDELRNVLCALGEDSSQLGVSEIAEATELTNRLGAMLSEKLSRKLRGSDNREGSSERGGGERS